MLVRACRHLQTYIDFIKHDSAALLALSDSVPDFTWSSANPSPPDPGFSDPPESQSSLINLASQCKDKRDRWGCLQTLQDRTRHEGMKTCFRAGAAVGASDPGTGEV